jgi:mannose-6-phosphate isomerase-like protein (cupin superfamily)
MLHKGDLPHLTNFSQARLQPGQVAAGHAHERMHEVFFVESGSGEIEVNGHVYPLHPGVCVAVEAGDVHEIRSAPSGELVLTYFGIEG